MYLSVMSRYYILYIFFSERIRRDDYFDDDEEEEYDSEMDDFIDDGDEGSNIDVSKCISEIFGYDKRR